MILPSVFELRTLDKRLFFVNIVAFGKFLDPYFPSDTKSSIPYR